MKDTAKVVPLFKSIHRCVIKRVPIYDAEGRNAEWVYDAIGLPSPGVCSDCGLPGLVEGWQEWGWSPKEQKYEVRRPIDFCEECRDARAALPLGKKWIRRRRTVRMARLDTVRRLEAVGDAEGAEAIRALLTR